jgi:tRNA A-37 threonylcarbamoyl transferase component Bud32
MTTDPDDQRLRQLLAAGLDASTASLPGEGWTAPAPEELDGVFPRLEVLALLGQGGMGAVYKARQTHLDRLVALKLLDPRLGRDLAFAERFRREALALARLAHPHIVALHDVGEAGGWHYLLMEYVDGATLRQALRTGRFSAGETLRFIPQLCDALAYAHEQGVVHRDLKPENILIDGAGRARIADFGLAKLSGEQSGGTITRTGQTLGTAAYLAPEQVAGAANVDHRADLYALGVVLYEMLTGQLPLGRFEPPSQRAQVDIRIDEVVLRALERTPELRWQSAGEVAKAMGAATAGAAAPASASPLRDRSGRNVLVAIACLMALTLVVIYRWNRADPSPAPAASTPPAAASEAVGSGNRTPPAPSPASAPALLPVEPPAAPLTPAPGAAPAGPITALEIDGGGMLTISFQSGGPALTLDIAKDFHEVMDANLMGDGVMHLALHDAPVPPLLVLPPGSLERLRIGGNCNVHLLHPAQDHLTLELSGTAAVVTEDLNLDRIDVLLRGLARIELDGSARQAHLQLAGTHAAAQLVIPISGGSIDIPAGAPAIDGSRLTAGEFDLSIAGGGQILLANHARSLRLLLSGSGDLAAPGLAVDRADLTMTGTGDAVLGRIATLDVTCTGTGHLQYTGNPRLGRVQTGP